MDNRWLVLEVIRDKHTYITVPPVEDYWCYVFKRYIEVPETVPLNVL